MDARTRKLMVATTAAGVTGGAVLASKTVMALLVVPVSGPLLALAALLTLSAVGGGAGVFAGRRVGAVIFRD